MRVIGAMLALFSTLLATFSTARPQPCPRQEIKAGQTVACDGIALSVQDAAKLAAAAKRSQALKVEVREAAVKLEAAQRRLDAARKACAGRLDACNAEADELRRRLLEPRKPLPTPVVQRPWFVATVAIVITAAIAVPVTWLAVTEAAR